ncbi:MAG: hypothetical protein JNM39_11430 [Bdellovibrionaceae bacterium]|nr:hypothetical protein [Pseudobdellovibrionaceae bacterium]
MESSLNPAIKIISLCSIVFSLALAQADGGGVSGGTGGGSGCHGQLRSIHLNLYNLILSEETGYEFYVTANPHLFWTKALEPSRLRLLLDQSSDPTNHQKYAAVYKGGKIVVRCDLLAAAIKKGTQHREVADAFFAKMTADSGGTRAFLESYIQDHVLQDKVGFDWWAPGPEKDIGVVGGDFIGVSRDFRWIATNSNGAATFKEDSKWQGPDIPPTEIRMHFKLGKTVSNLKKSQQSDSSMEDIPVEFDLKVSRFRNSYMSFQLSNGVLSGSPLPSFVYKQTLQSGRKPNQCEHTWVAGTVEICLKLFAGEKTYKIERLLIRRLAAKTKRRDIWFAYQNPGPMYLGNNNPIERAKVYSESFANIASQFMSIAQQTKDAGTLKINSSANEIVLHFHIIKYLFQGDYLGNEPLDLIFRITRGLQGEAVFSIDKMYTGDKGTINPKRMIFESKEPEVYVWKQGNTRIELETDNGLITWFSILNWGDGDDFLSDSRYWFIASDDGIRFDGKTIRDKE